LYKLFSIGGLHDGIIWLPYQNALPTFVCLWFISIDCLTNLTRE
jgi:hypothetical protein